MTSDLSPLRRPTTKEDPTNSADLRRLQVARLTAEHCQRHFTADGIWSSILPTPDTRKALWLAFGLFGDTANQAAIDLANAILERLAFVHHSRPRTPEEAASQFDIFITNHAVQLLVVHREKLTDPVRVKLEGWARHALGDFPGDHQADYQFHGANDNMPSKATLGLILGGEYFGDQRAIDHGLWNLRQLRALLTRRGLMSEYTCPTYSPLTLVNLTEIALHARHPEAATLARQCVERIWSDILGHFHAPTGTMAGPYSRSYQMDATAHFSTATCLLWLALGDDWASFNPLEELQRNPIRLVHHHSDITTQLGVLAWLTACPLIPPAQLIHWMEQRTYPFRLLANAERCGPESAEVHTSLYAEEDFALGTSLDEPWTRLQSEAFFLQYRRQAPRRDITGVRTLYARYLFNDQRPYSSGGRDQLQPQAMAHTIHKDRIALMLTRPLERLSAKPVTALKFSAVLPTHFGAIEHIEIQAGTTNSPCGHHVFIKEGPVYIALRGLHATRLGDDATDATSAATGIRIEPTDDGEFQVISFYNYAGPARQFAESEIVTTLNGFIAVIGLAAEETFDQFKQRVSSAQLLDYYAFDQRTITYQLGDTELSASFAPAANRFRFATIDGLPLPRPIWQADGLPAKRLPFLNAPAVTTPLESFPYDHLQVVWAPQLPWAINAR
jgi:hypothetical protein